MIIVQGCPFNLEIWSFYHNFYENNNLEEIKVSQTELDLFDGCNISNLEKTIDYFFKLFYSSSNLKKCNVPTNISYSNLFNEIETVIEKIMYYCVQETIPQSELKLVDINFCDTNCLNHRFRVMSFFMINIIRNQIESCSNVDLLNLNYETEDNRTVDKFYEEIKSSCKGDLYEFIEYVKIDIAKRTITKNHELIAKIEKFFLFDNTNFDEHMSQEDTFRILYKSYFEMSEKKFGIFFNTFQNECITYFINDFFKIEIEMIPFYSVFRLDGTIKAKPEFFFSTKKIDDEIIKIKNKYQN